MRLNLLYVDETEYWNEEVVADTGRIITVLLYSPDRRVHCCEITPSYECWFVGYRCEHMPEDEARRDGIGDILRQAAGDGDSVEYFHVSNINLQTSVRMRKTRNGRLDPFVTMTRNRISLCHRQWCRTTPRDCTYEEVIEGTLEYLRCNGYVDV